MVVLFGEDQDKMMQKHEGMNVISLIKKMFMCHVRYTQDPVRMLSFGVFAKMSCLQLSKHGREIRRLQKLVKKILIQEYNKRIETKSYLDSTSSTNFLNTVLRQNHNAENDSTIKKLTIEEICGYMELFQFAAQDTSYHASSSCLAFLAQKINQNIQEKVREEVQEIIPESEIYNVEELDKMTYLDTCVQETFRITPPAPMINERLVTKDFTLCDKIIKKGDVVSVVQVGLCMNKEAYDSPLKFDPSRFAKENIKRIPKLNHLPFSSGQRNCVGKSLGLAMVKMILAEFLREFNFKVKDDYVMKLNMAPLYGIENTDFIVSLRN